MKKKAIKEILAPRPLKPYVPQAHPQQSRIDAIREIKSLVTTHTHLIPQGK